MKRSKRGFTLVEMVVAMAASSIVVLAGMSFVTVCLRIQGSTYTEVSRQDTARVALTLVETMAGRGELKELPETKDDGDVVIKKDSKIVLYYDKDSNTIYVGGDKDSGTPLMQNAELDVLVNDRLLTVTLTDRKDDEQYTATVFCRGWARQPGPYLLVKEQIFKTTSGPEYDYRFQLLQTAVELYGSKGVFTDKDGNIKYFSEWYHGKFGDGWDKNTPWCACFVSWCIEQVGSTLNEVPRFANVNDGWTTVSSIDKKDKSSYDPVPGDLIFFNTDGDSLADHVGFVLKVETDSATSKKTIYTVEGNNNGLVVIAKYNKDDTHILGYGELKWKTTSTGGTP